MFEVQFDVQAVEEELRDTMFAGQLRHFPRVESTSTLALESAQAGARSGVWIADEQMAGRGRGGHVWHSAPGDGLYMSALIDTPLPISMGLLLSLAAGLAAKSALQQTTGLAVDIRWPNDLLIGERKCGGILVETAVSPATGSGEATLRYAVIGIGINVHHTAFPPELEGHATSLQLETPTVPSRERLLTSLLRSLDNEIQRLTCQWRGTANGASIHERFTGASTWVHGKHVSVAEGGGYTGITSGLDKRGFLLVRSLDGVLHTVLSGGVRAR